MPSPVEALPCGVEVDHQHLVAERRQRGPEVDRGGGLADPALLVGDGEDMRFRDGIQTRRSLRFPLLPPWGQSGWDVSHGRNASALRPRRSPYAPSRPSETSQFPPGAMLFRPWRAAPSAGHRPRRHDVGLLRRKPLHPFGEDRRRDGSPRRIAVARNAALRWSLSTRRTSRPGSASAAIAAITRPGNPAPEPRSSQRRAPGGPQAPRAAPNRRSAGPRPARGWRARPGLSAGSTRASNAAWVSSRAIVSRETSNARLKRRAVGDHERGAGTRRCRTRTRIWVSATGVIPSIRAACARRLRPHRLELAAQLRGKPADRRVVHAPTGSETASSRRKRAISCACRAMYGA